MGTGGISIGFDRQGHPSLFVPAAERRPGLALRSAAASLRLGVDCALHTEGQGEVRGRFHILQCEDLDATVVETFTLLLNDD